MKTYLLAWNPSRWKWDNISQMSEDVKNGKTMLDRWSTSHSKKPRKGDRFFLIRLGEEPKGIFASGMIETDAFEDLHWDEEKSLLGETTNYVTIKYDVLLNPETDLILQRDLLNMPLLSEMHWDTQMSGVQIPDKIALELESIWSSVTHSKEFTFPEEIELSNESFIEGAIKQITINAYERNSEARRKCIDYYGATCQICGFDFEQTYGKVGKGFIHIHHLKQISEIGKEYKIDPIKDLLPVCPNCHAIIHRRTPPYTIEEVKTFLKNPF